MGCTKMGHIHQWPTSGTLVIQRCEVRCNFCEGEASKKDWKYAWFLRRHVRAMHVKKGQYPKLRVDGGWDEGNLRGPPARFGIKKEEESSDDDEPAARPTFISQPIYEEQREQGMTYPAFVNPAGILANTADAEFDFNDYHPFPVFGNEIAAFDNENEFSHTAVNFHDFLDDATGGHGMLPSGTRHGRTELDADGLPIVEDYDLPESTVMPEPTAKPEFFCEPKPVFQETGDEYDRFYDPNFNVKTDEGDVADFTRLSDRPIGEIIEQGGAKIDSQTLNQVLGSLSMATDAMTAEGVNGRQLLTCIGHFARYIAKTVDVDVKPTFDYEGYALNPNPMTL